MLKPFHVLKSFSFSTDQRLWALTLAALVPLLYMMWHGQLNPLASAIIFFLLFILSLLDKNLAICATFVYLFFLGDIRRIVGSFIGYPTLDTLLLVGPGFAAILALPLFLRLRLTDPASKAVFALMVVMTLEIFNPRQGPIAVGAAGALFYIIPLLWFWIGRRYGTEALLAAVIYRVIIPVGVLAALLGIYQSFVGFLPWEQTWINAVSAHYHSLSLAAGLTRPFGFSVNSVEYGGTLLITCTCVAAAFFAGKRVYGLLFPVLIVALFLSSSRGSIVRFLFAIALAWAVSSKGGRGWTLRLPLALGGGVAVLVFSLSHLAGGGGAKQTTAVGASAQHQAQGLAHPLDKKYSTAGLHSQMFLGGIARGFTVPIGNGLGAATLGAGKFGGDDSASGSSEVDISDAFSTMGAIGGLLYLLTIFLILRTALTYARTALQRTGLALIGTLASTLGGWLALGQYATSPLIWFLIGTLSYSQNLRRLPEAAAAWSIEKSNESYTP